MKLNPPSSRSVVRSLVAVGLVIGCSDLTPTGPASPDVAVPVAAPPQLASTASAITASPVLVGAGDIANCDRLANAEGTAALLDGIEGTVFTVGDNAFRDGSATQYADCYDPTWGRHKARTMPAPGERDYRTANAAGYFGYFGAAAGDPAKGYYSYALGDWHVVVLNTSLSLSASSAQLAWLQGDLSAGGAACTAVMMHRPYYSSVTGAAGDFASLWTVLHGAGVELVVSGHAVVYERFAPQDAAGALDATHGVRQFVVGTGGAAHQAFGTIRPNSEARATAIYGVLKLTLNPGGYDWQYVQSAGPTFTESGSAACHGAPGGTTPTTGELRVTAATSGANVDPDGYQATVYDAAGANIVAGPKAVAVDGSASFPGLPAATYTVQLGGVAANCSTGLANHVQQATVTAGGTVTAAYAVTCSATTGALTVSATTTGQDPDPDGYTATVDAGTSGATSLPVTSTAPATFTGLSAGTHTVTLGGVAANCATGVPNDRLAVDVVAGSTATASFTVTCSAVISTGSIAVSVTTSGLSPDPDGYTLTLDPGTAQASSRSVGSNGSVTFADVSATTHTLALGGIASNCTPATNPLTVAVVAGATTSASFSVTCAPVSSELAYVFVGAGDIAACGSAQQARAQATAAIIDDLVELHSDVTVFTAGDNAYPNGRAIDYQNCYEPTWGRHKARTWATLGNHEYDTGTADPSFDYFGQRAGPRGKGYYTVELGDWLVIVLNDNIAFGKGSAQDVWLQGVLASSTKRCTIALWHQPYTWSQGTSGGRSGPRKIFWDRLHAAGVEISIHGHRHFYERFAPMNPDRERDDARGMRQFIVGTGGEDVWPPTSPSAANSEALSPRDVVGVLKLTLRADEYDWEFIPGAGQTWTDSGSGTCHD